MSLITYQMILIGIGYNVKVLKNDIQTRTCLREIDTILTQIPYI
jgi:hypothetical protein